MVWNKYQNQQQQEISMLAMMSYESQNKWKVIYSFIPIRAKLFQGECRFSECEKNCVKETTQVLYLYVYDSEKREGGN